MSNKSTPSDRQTPSESPTSRTTDESTDGGGTEDGLSPAESAVLDRVRRVAKLQDEAIRVPGTDFRFGLDPVLSILPVGGDLLAAAISLYPVAEAARLGVPKRTVATMLALVTVDAVVGSIPVFGTMFDAVWKANEWNRRLLERQVDQS